MRFKLLATASSTRTGRGLPTMVCRCCASMSLTDLIWRRYCSQQQWDSAQSQSSRLVMGKSASMGICLRKAPAVSPKAVTSIEPDRSASFSSSRKHLLASSMGARQCSQRLPELFAQDLRQPGQASQNHFLSNPTSFTHASTQEYTAEFTCAPCSSSPTSLTVLTALLLPPPLGRLKLHLPSCSVKKLWRRIWEFVVELSLISPLKLVILNFLSSTDLPSSEGSTATLLSHSATWWATPVTGSPTHSVCSTIVRSSRGISFGGWTSARRAMKLQNSCGLQACGIWLSRSQLLRQQGISGSSSVGRNSVSLVKRMVKGDSCSRLSLLQVSCVTLPRETRQTLPLLMAEYLPLAPSPKWLPEIMLPSLSISSTVSSFTIFPFLLVNSLQSDSTTRTTIVQLQQLSQRSLIDWGESCLSAGDSAAVLSLSDLSYSFSLLLLLLLRFSFIRVSSRFYLQSWLLQGGDSARAQETTSWGRKGQGRNGWGRNGWGRNGWGRNGWGREGLGGSASSFTGLAASSLSSSMNQKPTISIQLGSLCSKWVMCSVIRTRREGRPYFFMRGSTLLERSLTSRNPLNRCSPSEISTLSFFLPRLGRESSTTRDSFIPFSMDSNRETVLPLRKLMPM